MSRHDSIPDDRRKKLHELVDLREELRDLQTNLQAEESRFAESVKKRSVIMNTSDKGTATDNEDEFLENLRITEQDIHTHRTKILDIQSQIIDKKEMILSLELLVKLDEQQRPSTSNGISH
ncbi:unnamed protein product [Caenorhabditis bovis]|uniref:Uncharacterized protein n=1 Tax=Caenorhabditis bovis TaxID=2654633 RepID=A0A8S1F892_9PELO|nr:unnamed protein product [Caenorhabditis bovis]